MNKGSFSNIRLINKDKIMKRLLIGLVLLTSLASFAKDRSVECGVESQKSKIEVLHLFASAFLTNEGLMYVGEYRSALDLKNKEYYTCTDVQKLSKSISKGLVKVIEGMALVHGYGKSKVDFATDMYCENSGSPNNESICKVDYSDTATTNYIFGDKKLKKILKKALE